MLRVAIIGARRARQGLGPFVARDLALEGMNICAVSATSEKTAELAAAEIVTYTGQKPKAFTNIAEMLRVSLPHVVAILSPPETHEEYLWLSLDAHCHVICEKPLIWNGVSCLNGVENIAAHFSNKKLVLFENCQWPQVVPAIHELHPDLCELPKVVKMHLTPDSIGIESLRDCASHLISVLQSFQQDPLALVSDCQVVNGIDELRLSFLFGTERYQITAIGVFNNCNILPRPASLSIDGYHAIRKIDPSTYSMRLVGCGRSVSLPDPLTKHLGLFVQQVRSISEDVDIANRVEMVVRARAVDSLLRTFILNS